MRPAFDLFTYHSKLVFIFCSSSLIPGPSESCVRKLLRWDFVLIIYNYVCYHICGEGSICAELFGRWSTRPIIRRRLSIPLDFLDAIVDFVWPKPEEIQQI